MFEIVFALLMYMGDKLENYSPKNSIADCLEQKRKVERHQGSNVNWSCKQVEAIVETDKHGVKRIKEIKSK
jgi:hypothetical protein